MADPVGIFDPSIAPAGWFDETAQPGGWFDRSLVTVDAGGGGGVNYTLSGDAGAYVFTGRSATFKVGHTLSGSPGAYTFTGRAATFKVGHTLSGSPGSYSLSGQSATFKVGHSLSGAPGAYALTGNAATLSYTPGAGPVNYTLSGDAGTYAITGRSATFNVGHALAGAAGAYAFAGQAGTLTYTPGATPANYTLSGDAGAYVLTGGSATFVVPASQPTAVGGFGSPRQWSRKIETEEEKRARRLAQGIISQPVEILAPVQVRDTAADTYVQSLKASVAEAMADVERWKAKAVAFDKAKTAQDLADKLDTQLQAEIQKAAAAQAEMAVRLAEAEHQAEIAAQELEALDIAFVMLHLAEM